MVFRMRNHVTAWDIACSITSGPQSPRQSPRLLVFVGTAAAATWMDVNGIIKNNSVGVIGQGSLNTDASIIDPNSGKPIEFVLIGQDSRDGAENQAIGGSFDDVIGNHQPTPP